MGRSQLSCLGFSQQSYFSTQEVEKEPEEEPLHNIISDTESVQGPRTTADIILFVVEAHCSSLFVLCSQFYGNLNANVFLIFPGSFSKHEFQAETKKLLDIVARSLYSEKEVRCCMRQ